MEIDENTDYESMLDGSHRGSQEHTCNMTVHCEDSLTMTIKPSSSDNSDKPIIFPGAVWTTSATSTLLKLYEAKLEMLETPKKKTRIWIAISENLKSFDIEMTPDQVRWKINALTKKYKQCIDSGQHDKFKYFNEMDNIYAKYNVDCVAYVEILQKKKGACKNPVKSMSNDTVTKGMLELRKNRLASRIEADKNQSKMNIEKQWMRYLTMQEEQSQLRDNIYDRNLKLREEELELRKKELEMKEDLEIRRLQLKEKEHDVILQLEREKCELLKQIFA